MSLEKQVVEEMKTAMKAKDKLALETLRAIKSAILLAKTESGAGEELNQDQELKLVQKLQKQRKEAADIYTQQGRDDLAKEEEAQAEILAKFLPKPLTDEELDMALKAIVDRTGASGMQDMGKVMGIASKELMGKADGKRISAHVREILK